jgi:hypothetical protein
MGHIARLQLVGRITYYVGWLTLVCGGLVHVNIAKTLFMNIDLSQRNLFEFSVMCFLICVASELRALASTGETAPSVVKKQVAA